MIVSWCASLSLCARYCICKLAGRHTWSLGSCLLRASTLPSARRRGAAPGHLGLLWGWADPGQGALGCLPAADSDTGPSVQMWRAVSQDDPEPPLALPYSLCVLSQRGGSPGLGSWCDAAALLYQLPSLGTVIFHYLLGLLCLEALFLNNVLSSFPLSQQESRSI